MTRIAGIKILRDRRGKAKQVIIDVKKHEALIEDLLDNLDIKLTEKDELIPAGTVFKKLDKKHGLTSKK